MITGREFARMYSANDYEERLYSTGNEYLDDLLERAFCEGYEYAQREFAEKEEEEEENKRNNHRALKTAAGIGGATIGTAGLIYGGKKLGNRLTEKGRIMMADDQVGGEQVGQAERTLENRKEALNAAKERQAKKATKKGAKEVEEAKGRVKDAEKVRRTAKKSSYGKGQRMEKVGDIMSKPAEKIVEVGKKAGEGVKELTKEVSEGAKKTSTKVSKGVKSIAKNAPKKIKSRLKK